nr:ATPase, T2SS/T4P/T4SS family [uncultured Desulfobacter sp.]
MQNNPIQNKIIAALVDDGFLTPEKAKIVERVKSKLSSETTIIKVLKDLNYITDSQLKKILRSDQLSLRIGDLLVEFGHLTPEKLKAALDIQSRERGKQLGQIIIDHQFMSEHDFLEVLSVQLGFPFVNLSVEELDSELIDQAPMKWCHSNNFLPVRKEEDRVIVAFADPFNQSSINSAKKLYGDKIEIAISSPGSIDRLLHHLVSGRKSDKLMDENTAMGIVDTIISAAIVAGASDIHIEPLKDRLQVKFRIDGILVFHRELPPESTAMVTARIKVLAKADIAEKRKHQDGRLSFEHKGNVYDLRASFYAAVFGEKVVLRILNRIDQIIPIEEIGMSPKMLTRYLRDVLGVPSGVLIITGPTGSGQDHDPVFLHQTH